MISEERIDMLFSSLYENMDIVKLSNGTKYFKAKFLMWETIAEKLNALAGPKRTIKIWRSYYNSKIRKTRNKMKAIVNNQITKRQLEDPRYMPINYWDKKCIRFLIDSKKWDLEFIRRNRFCSDLHMVKEPESDDELYESCMVNLMKKTVAFKQFFYHVKNDIKFEEDTEDTETEQTSVSDVTIENESSSDVEVIEKNEGRSENHYSFKESLLENVNKIKPAEKEKTLAVKLGRLDGQSVKKNAVIEQTSILNMTLEKPCQELIVNEKDCSQDSFMESSFEDSNETNPALGEPFKEKISAVGLKECNEPLGKVTSNVNKCSDEQTDILFSWMSDYAEVIKRGYKGERKKQFWEIIAQKLNAVDGPKKADWKSYYKSRRYQTYKKMVAIIEKKKRKCVPGLRLATINYWDQKCIQFLIKSDIWNLEFIRRNRFCSDVHIVERPKSKEELYESCITHLTTELANYKKRWCLDRISKGPMIEKRTQRDDLNRGIVTLDLEKDNETAFMRQTLLPNRTTEESNFNKEVIMKRKDCSEDNLVNSNEMNPLWKQFKEKTLVVILKRFDDPVNKRSKIEPASFSSKSDVPLSETKAKTNNSNKSDQPLRDPNLHINIKKEQGTSQVYSPLTEVLPASSSVEKLLRPLGLKTEEKENDNRNYISTQRRAMASPEPDPNLELMLGKMDEFIAMHSQTQVAPTSSDNIFGLRRNINVNNNKPAASPSRKRLIGESTQVTLRQPYTSQCYSNPEVNMKSVNRPFEENKLNVTSSTSSQYYYPQGFNLGSDERNTGTHHMINKPTVMEGPSKNVGDAGIMNFQSVTSSLPSSFSGSRDEYYQSTGTMEEATIKFIDKEMQSVNEKLTDYVNKIERLSDLVLDQNRISKNTNKLLLDLISVLASNKETNNENQKIQ